MVKALARLLEAHGITWDPIHNHIACLAHVFNLAVKKFLSTLKIQCRTLEDEWEVLEYKAQQKSTQKYQILGTSPFDRAIQKIRKISNLVNYPLGHVKAFEQICELKNIVPMRAVKDVETRWNSTYSMLARAVYLWDAINM